MRLKGSDLFSTKLALIVFLVGTAVFGFGYLKQISVRPAAARTEAASPVRFEVKTTESAPVNVVDNGSPWLNLKQGKPIGSEYVGTGSAVSRFESGQLRPTAIVTADTNFDGLADAISGFAGPDGGVITIHTASREAFAPESEATLAGLRRGEFPSAFDRQARVIEVPIAPEFIVSGKFTGSDLDIIFGSRTSNSLYIISSDGRGGFGSPTALDMGGNVTALAADSLAPSKARTGLVVAVNGDNGSSLVVFDGEGTFGESRLKSLVLDRQIDSLVLTSPDGITLEKDLFLLGGGTLSRINAISKGDVAPVNIELPFRAAAFAAGEFIRDRRATTELAVLGENGVVYYLKNGQLDTRPITESEMRAEFAKNGRGRTRVINSEDTGNALANDWSVAEESNLGIINTSRQSAGSLLMRSRVTGNETDDLVVINPADKKVSVLFKEPNYETNRSSFTGETKTADLGFASEIAAVLPMRLNVMGQQGIAVLEGGKLEPTPIMFAPEATFVVTKTADTADGACNADCSLREAVVAANGAVGADLITFGVSGNHQLTVGAAGENGAGGGDLDVTQSTTITGNGSASTILQGGSSVGTGIDKVLSINPLFTSAFATSITGVTVRFGRNPSSFATDGFGGGFDWEGSGTGTLSVTNTIVTDNRTVDGDGGGIVATNTGAGAGTFTLSGTTVSNNIPARVAAASPFGGGVFVGTTTPYFLTNSTISGNSTAGSGSQGQGGGLFAFGPGGIGGNSFLATSSIANNAAPSDAGGIYTTQRIDINPGSSITGNTSGRFGGGLFVNHGSATSTISKATITGNSATTTGSGIYLGTTTTSNLLNMSFSRIAGNTGAGLKGLATAGGTATAQNNWWGCNTVSTAGPCDTTGNTGAGSVNAVPFLQLRLSAASSPINVGQTSALTASFLLNSGGGVISPADLNTLIGQTVIWGSTFGSISDAQTTIQSNGTATATYTGTSAGAGTATATVDSGTATANITVNNPTADLSITKTDGSATEIPGTPVTYSITASNAGPSPVTGATVADTFPATITGVTWTCVGAGGGTCTAAGSGNISDTVNLPSGGSVTYTATGTISASATGTLVNTATVSSSVTDPNPGNNSATDTDTLVPTADLSITKTDGTSTEVPGTAITYTIVASNAGPSNAPGTTVADTFPATITGVTWTCVGAGGGTCTAAGSGNINDTVNLPSGGSVTYTATGTISASATGTLVNTASVTAAGGITDPSPGNNSATDSDTLVPTANLGITKTDGVTTVTAGGSTTYTITASNAGPSNAPGSTVADTFPATLTGTWTCVGAGGGTCTASGSGNINDTVNLPSGGSVTYTVSATISASATGTLSNTATVATAGGVTDPTPGNNSATDTNTIAQSANLGITKTDGVTTVTAGGSTTYTITASNAGPSNAPGSTVADTFPPSLTGTWTCVGAGGGTCTASGSGNINDTVNLPSGGSVTYTVSANISASAIGALLNTATVSTGGGVTDPTPGNNSASDANAITQSANLGITKTDGVTTVTAGGSTTYTITASNAGPSNAPGSTVADTFPASLTGTWTCVGAGGGTCNPSGSGNINDTVNLPSGGSVTYTVSAAISAAATGTLSNTATVTAAGGVTDPTPGNNSATDTNTVTQSANLGITKTDGVTTVTAGGSTTYTITASNAGPSNAPGSTVADTFPASLTGTWTCVGAGGGTCTASGSGNINDTVNLPSGGSVTYTVSAAISAAATGTLSNTATVTAPGGVTDPTPGNNSATDTNTIAQSANLGITKTDGVTTVTAGGSTTYTIVASNAGPSNVTGATVADTFPSAITAVNWTCVGAGGGTCTASGSGNINDTVNLPVGGSVTYTAVSTISVSATGTLSNTATVSSSVTDPTPGNNSATDTDTIIPSDTTPPTAVAALTNVNGPGGTLYTFTVTYADASGINVSTLDNNDITVTGPSAFTTPATFVSVDVNTNGTPRVATYSFVPPGGTWDPADSGVYNVSMNASQVADTVGNFVSSGSLGTFYAVPPVYFVDRTDDSVAASACTAAANDCTLRGAIAAANTSALPDTINFDPVVFATPQTITLGGTEIVIANSGGLTINGPGADKLTVSGNAASRIFSNSPNAVTTISSMRLTGGTGTGAAGTGRGGAVYNTGGTLTLNGLILTGNTSANGAALTNATAPATLNVNNCWITANSTPGSGGAIQNFSGATVVTNITNSSITGNTSNSTSVGGGAIQANGTVTITNSTIGGNTAVGGSGAIFYNGTNLTITNSTISGNTSTQNGGGIHSTSATPASIRNSIIAGNNGAVASVDMTGIAASQGNNIIGTVGTSTGWVASDLQNVNPLLAPLGYYGGNGYSFALTSASPAFNAGQACVLTLTCTGPNPASPIITDQRGAARIGAVDIGAFELNNSANGGSYVAVLPSGLQNSPYSFQLAANNGTFTQAVTSGSLPAGILLTTALAPQTATSLAGTPSVYGLFAFGITATSGANSNLTDYRLTVFAAPGTPLSVSGRITDTNGQPIRNALVILTDSGSFKRGALTSSFGYYRIDSVPAGPGYTIAVSSKRYTFTPVAFDANLDVTGLDLVGTPIP